MTFSAQVNHVLYVRCPTSIQVDGDQTTRQDESLIGTIQHDNKNYHTNRLLSTSCYYIHSNEASGLGLSCKRRARVC